MLDANRPFFRDRPNFLELLGKAPDAWSIEIARRGDVPVPVRTSDGRWLLSRYDPVRETERWLGEQALGDDDLPVLIGFNPHVLAACSLRPLIVVEQDASLVKAVLDGIDLSGSLDGVSILVDQDGFAMMSAVRNLHDIFRHRRIRFLPAPQVEDGAWVKRVVEHGLKIQREIGLNAMSYSLQLPKWMTTIKANLEAALEGPDAHALMNALPGATAVLVGAGPSLERNLETLRLFQGRAVIVAVDTALRRLDKAGIIPDIAVAVDANDLNARDVDGLSERLLSSTILVADHIASPAIVRAFRGPRTFLRSINYTYDLEGAPVEAPMPMDDFLRELAGRARLASWQSGGSVSTNAFCLCHMLGVKRVILVGQDLAFTGGQTHAMGVAHEDDDVRTYGRFINREIMSRRASSDAEFSVPGWHGGYVRTNEVLREYLTWFEMTIERGFGNTIEVIDATEGGAAKRGTRRITLADAFKLVKPLAQGKSLAAGKPTSAPLVELTRRLRSAAPAGAAGWRERLAAWVARARSLESAPPERIIAELPLAPWLVLPAYLGSFDMSPEERAAVQRAGLVGSVDFLLKVFR